MDVKVDVYVRFSVVVTSEPENATRLAERAIGSVVALTVGQTIDGVDVIAGGLIDIDDYRGERI